MKSRTVAFSLFAALPLLTGCVERTLLLRSDPPGAQVAVNGADAGIAPARVTFDTYGTFEVVMSAPHCLRLRAEVPVKPPWWEWIPLDFFSEALWPATLHDEHAITLKLEPAQEGAAVGAGIDERERKLQERTLQGVEIPSVPAKPEAK